MDRAILAPEQAAIEFRQRHSLGNAPIRDMIQVIEDFRGAFVFSRPFPTMYAAFTVHDEVSGTTIVAVGTTDNPERQRFTIAHELAHLESGRMSADVHSMPEFSRNPDEIWADNFARHLLLPLNAIDAYLTEAERTKGSITEKSLSDLVRVFGISPAAALIQMRDSGWISPGLYDEWRNATPSLTSRALSIRHGWASERAAMVKLTLTPRRPIQVVEAATSAYRDGQTSLEALAQASGESDLDSYRDALEESGITPVRSEPDASDDWDAEDLSDLFRSDG